MTIKNNFFQKRRSVMANKMDSSPIDKKDIDTILAAGIRVPDHGALSPWKLITIQGQSLTKIDKEILLPEFKKTNSNADEEIIEAQTQRFQRAGLVIAVLSTPVKHSFMNLLSCAQSLGYAAIWLTEWYAYNEKLLIHLGGRVEQDKVSGFIYIGHKKEEPLERKRPDPEKVIKHL